MASITDSHEVFNNLSTKFTQLLYGRSEGDRALINKILDELNSLNYRYPVVTNGTRAVLLINQFCNLIPPDDSFLVAKCCSLITNLVNRQRVAVEGRTLTVTIDWILQALKQVQDVVTIDILVTLDALLRTNVQHVNALLPNIVTKNGALLQHVGKDKPAEVVLLAVQCLEACCGVPEDYKSLDTEKSCPQYEMCAEVFRNYLLMQKPSRFDDLVYSKLLISCLRGLQNIIEQNEGFLIKEIGLLLGITKSYMVYQLNGIDFLVPQKVMPSVLSIPDPPQNSLREKKGGKVTKLRKQRVSGVSKKDGRKSEHKDYNEDFQSNNGYTPATISLDIVEDIVTTNPGLRIKTSDSDFSDSEAGKGAKICLLEGRVRQAALKFLLNICKNTDKKTMFSYWSSFIPEAPLSGSHSLANCILKDPSPRGRMAALNVLLLLLSSSKLYLSQAEFSDRTASFVPFSVILGSIVKELHHCLSLALNETSYPVLTLALKCMASLVQATPYHRLGPGLANKVIRNVKLFIYHKDTTVQVAALIVLGCILASEPTVKETEESFLKNVPARQTEASTKDSTVTLDEFEYAEFSSSEDEEIIEGVSANIPWLLDRCLKNLGVGISENKDRDTVPSPVKLESLQVISAMSRNYFEDLVLPYLTYITKALELALVDKYIDVRLHAGRTVDFVGQAMNQYFTAHVGDTKINYDQSLPFWQTLLNNSLISLLHCEQYPTLRTAGCDCIGSIGPHAFEQLPRDKQLLCITLLFTCSRDEDNTVKGSAIRALAISVLYPSLREDPGFIMDTAEAIHRTLNDENVGLRIKSSWSLANLSDALVLNKSDPHIYENIPDSVLLSLIEDSVKGCDDNKIKSNTVRALGNLLQLINNDLSEDEGFYQASKRAINSLIDCAASGTNMKVRWNACYALGNVLKNQSLYKINNSWLQLVFSALSNLVVSFKNFKVRINAALALSLCPSRDLYGSHFTSIWNVLIKALENSENMEDFSEYKHRDHLIEQICLSLGHLVTLMTADDLSSWNDTFSESALKIQIRKVYDHVIPEKSTVLFAASEHLASLHCQTSGQCEVLAMLRNVFNNDIDF